MTSLAFSDGVSEFSGSSIIKANSIIRGAGDKVNYWVTKPISEKMGSRGAC